MLLLRFLSSKLHFHSSFSINKNNKLSSYLLLLAKLQNNTCRKHFWRWRLHTLSVFVSRTARIQFHFQIFMLKHQHNERVADLSFWCIGRKKEKKPSAKACCFWSLSPQQINKHHLSGFTQNTMGCRKKVQWVRLRKVGFHQKQETDAGNYFTATFRGDHNFHNFHTKVFDCFIMTLWGNHHFHNHSFGNFLCTK